jgi:chromate transporter
MAEGEAAPDRSGRLREVAWLFFRLGATAFGGPLAHIAMMEREVVRRGWVTREEFVDLVGVTNLLPGPNSTEMAIHLGHKRAGAPGLVAAGACFILPAAAITLGLAWAYVRFGQLPETAAVLHGTKPVIVAVVAQALVTLARTAVKRRSLALIGAAAAVAAGLGVNEVLVLLAAGALATALAGGPPRAPSGDLAPEGTPSSETRVPAPSPADPRGPGRKLNALLFAAGPAAAGTALPFGLWPLFLVFLKIGSVLFGSGYVLLAFLRADLVDRLHWMTEAQLLDAVTAGQVTPGPVFTTATFIGYVLGGGAGALAATVGIFLPAFVFVAASGPIVARVRRSVRARGFLDGVNVASLALMAVVTARLGKAAIVDPLSAVVAVASAAVLLRFRPNATWLVLAGAAIGLLARAATAR